MIVQLLEALVEAVYWQKESFGIRNVYCHGHIQSPTCLPHGIETFVIHLHERPRGYVLPQIESQRFQDFQAARANLVRATNFICLELAVSRLIGALPPGL